MTLSDVLAWIRRSWEHRQTLLPAPATGLAGHSYGAMHAGILATRTDVAAVASLSGEWNEWLPSDGPLPIHRLRIPQLFTWGTGDSENSLGLPDDRWRAVARPKHRAVFTNGGHFDYLYTSRLPCRSLGERGPCRWLGAATNDLVTMFFAKYLPPELWPNLPDRVPSTLRPPRLVLTQEQKFFAGGHLSGMGLFDADQPPDGPCDVAITRELSTDRRVPYVRFTPRNLAAQMVQRRDLVPVFTGTGGPDVPWVFSQSPAAGTTVSAGSEVRMRLRGGPIP